MPEQVSFIFMLYFFLIILETVFPLGKRNFEVLANALLLTGLFESFYWDCDCILALYHSSSLGSDYISKWFVFLNFFTWLMSNLTASFTNHSLSKCTLYFLLMLINFLIWQMMSTNSMIMFYTYFELSVMPIFLLIGAWGYNPERDVAAVVYLFLSVMFASPLVLVFFCSVLTSPDTIFNPTIISLETPHYQLCSRSFFFIFMCLPWMMKMPLFYFHIWLNKAHVEAPIYGSAELAGILMKVSVVGAHRFIYSFEHCYFMLESLKTFSLGSFLIASAAAFFMGDFKLIIAMSSVSHVCMPFFCIMSMKFFPMLSCIFYLIGHSFATMSLFISGQMLYQRLGSRMVKLIMGMISDFIFAVLFFMSVICSMGVPPTIGFLMEILLCFFSVSISLFVVLFLFIGLFCVAVYSLALYTASVTKDLHLEKMTVLKISFFLSNIIFLNVWVFIFTNFMLWNFT